MPKLMANAAAEKSADELRREIDELHRQQREITERLRDPRGLRKGGFPGGARNAAGPLRPGGRGGFQRGSLRRGPVGEADGQPPLKRRLLSAVVKVDDGEESAEPGDAQYGEVQEKDAQLQEEGDQRPTGAAIPLPGRRDSRSGDRGFTEPEDLIVEPQPRILPTTEDPNLAKRNRRMFGALLGTLEKFRQEDQKMSGSEAYMRRSDSLRRAEQKAHEESERLRQQEREQLAEKRKTDLILRAQLAAKTEEKQLELLFIQWSEHHTKLSPFLRTKAEPGIFYIPAKPSEETDKLLEDRKKELTEWRSVRRQELIEYQLQTAAAHISHVEAEIEKWQSRSQGRNNGGTDEVDLELGMEIANGPKKFGLRISKTVEEEDQDKADEDGEDELEVPDDDDDAHKKTGNEPGVLTGVLGYGSLEEEVEEVEDR